MVTVVLTQPEPRVSVLARELRQAGVEPQLLSFSSLQALPDGLRALQTRLAEPFDRIVFVSPSSVWFARSLLPDIVTNCAKGIAVIGAGTEAALNEHLSDAGLTASVIRPEQPPYDADALLALPAMAVQSILVVRGRQGRDDWIETARARGLNVKTACLYESQPLTPGSTDVARFAGLAEADEKALIMVTSLAHARALCAWSTGRSFEGWLRRQPCLVSHPKVAACLTDGGFSRVMAAPAQGSLLDAAIQWSQIAGSH